MVITKTVDYWVNFIAHMNLELLTIQMFMFLFRKIFTFYIVYCSMFFTFKNYTKSMHLAYYTYNFSI